MTIRIINDLTSELVTDKEFKSFTDAYEWIDENLTEPILWATIIID